MAEVDIGRLWSFCFCRFLCLYLVRDLPVVLIAGMRKPGAEDVRRAVRKSSSSKKAQKGVDEGAPAALPAPKRLCIGGAAPPTPKKPRADKGVMPPVPKKSRVDKGVEPGERSEAPLTEGVVDLTASPGARPKRVEADQGAPARPSAAVGPSEPGPSHLPSSTQVPLGAVGRDFTEAESLGEVSAFGDLAAAISLFQSILLPLDAAEMSYHSPTEIADSMFPALTWVSRPTWLFFCKYSRSVSDDNFFCCSLFTAD